MNNESMRICCRRTTTMRQSSHCFPAWRIYIPWDQCYCPPPSRETFTTKDSGGVSCKSLRKQSNHHYQFIIDLFRTKAAWRNSRKWHNTYTHTKI